VYKSWLSDPSDSETPGRRPGGTVGFVGRRLLVTSDNSLSGTPLTHSDENWCGCAPASQVGMSRKEQS
jgi:hypothetical protein